MAYRRIHKGICRACQREMQIYARGLCSCCVKKPELREQFQGSHKYFSKDDGKPRLPLLKTYPNTQARQRCACGLNWDGECPPCEERQREGIMTMILEEQS